MHIAELAQKLQPYVLGWLQQIGVSTAGGAPTPHDLNSAHHSGTLADDQAPQFLKLDGSRTLTGNLAAGDGVTIDGVDVSAFKTAYDDHVLAPAAHHAPVSIGTGGLSAKLGIVNQVLTLAAINHSDLSNVSADQHHNQVHSLTGSDHTASGLTAGHTLLATGASSFAWGQMQHSYLGGVSADQHHAGFVGLEDHAGTAVTPATDDRIQLFTNNNILSITAGTNALTFTVNQGNIDHGSIAGLGDDDHPRYAEHAAAETITGAWQWSVPLLPSVTDTYDLGSATALWRKGWLSELESILFVQNSVQVTGGWWMVPHGSGTLAEAVDGSQTTVDFGQAMATNDFVLLRGNGQVEYLQVGALVAGTVYNVTRNVDGSGANAWPQGHVFVVLGNSGDGRIEFDAQTAGPRVSVFEQGAAYNAQTERVRIGDLAGWGPVVSGYGWAAGDYAGGQYAYYAPGAGLVVSGKVTASEGLIGGWTLASTEMHNTNIWLDAAAKQIAVGSQTFGADGIQLEYNGGNPRAYIGDGATRYFKFDGTTITFQAANTTLDASGNLTASNATLSGAITASSGSLGNLSVTGKLTMSGASSAIAIGTTPPTGSGAGTGIWIDRTGIYGLASNAQQVKISAADGKLTAGGGNVVLDKDGISISSVSSFDLKAAVKVGSGYLWSESSMSNGNVVYLDLMQSPNYYGRIRIGIKTEASMHFELQGAATRNFYFTGAPVSIGNSLSVLTLMTADRIHVGGLSDPGSGSLQADGGLTVGSAGSTAAGTGDVQYSGSIEPVRGGTTYTGRVLQTYGILTDSADQEFTTSQVAHISGNITVPTGGGILHVTYVVQYNTTAYTDICDLYAYLRVAGVQRTFGYALAHNAYAYGQVICHWVGAVSAGSTNIAGYIRKGQARNTHYAKQENSYITYALYI